MEMFMAVFRSVNEASKMYDFHGDQLENVMWLEEQYGYFKSCAGGQKC